MCRRFIRFTSVGGGGRARSACIRPEGDGEHRLGGVCRCGPFPASRRSGARSVVRPRLDGSSVRSPTRAAVEGLFAEAKQNHCLSRAKYRGRSKVQIQAYLCAMAQNLKRLLFPLYQWLAAC